MYLKHSLYIIYISPILCQETPLSRGKKTKSAIINSTSILARVYHDTPLVFFVYSCRRCPGLNLLARTALICDYLETRWIKWAALVLNFISTETVVLSVVPGAVPFSHGGTCVFISPAATRKVSETAEGAALKGPVKRYPHPVSTR